MDSGLAMALAPVKRANNLQAITVFPAKICTQTRKKKVPLPSPCTCVAPFPPKKSFSIVVGSYGNGFQQLLHKLTLIQTGISAVSRLAFFTEIQAVCGLKNCCQKFNVFLMGFPVLKAARILKCQKSRIPKC